MGRQRREQRTAIDEEGPSGERISGERAMGRPDLWAVTAIIYAAPYIFLDRIVVPVARIE